MNQNNDVSSEPRRGFRPPRWLWITAAAVVLLVVSGAVALKLIFPPEKLRQMVMPRLEAAVGREVQLSAVRLKLFPPVAIRLEGLAIANAPGFGPEPALRVDALDLRVRLLPFLLRRDVELSRVRLLRPEIRYEVAADGTSNFTGIGPVQQGSRPGRAEQLLAASSVAGSVLLDPSGVPGRAQGDEGNSGEGAPALIVNDLVLDDGSVHYRDHGDGTAARFSVEARLSADQLAGYARALDGDGTVSLSSIVALVPRLGPDSIPIPDLDGEYRLFLDLAADSLLLAPVELTFGDIPLEGAAGVTGLRGDRRVRLALESGEIGVARLLNSLPEALRPQNIDADGVARIAVQVDGPMAGEAKPDVQGSVELAEIAARHTEYGQVLTGGSGGMRFDRESLNVPSFAGDVFGRPMEFQLQIANFEAPIATGQVTGELDLGRLSELRENGARTDGIARLDLTFQAPVREPRGARVTGPVRLEEIEYRSESFSVPARISAATVQLTGLGIRSDAVPVRLGDSDLTVSFSGERLLAGALAMFLRDPADAEPVGAPHVEFRLESNRLAPGEFLTSDTSRAGYSDLVTARLAGKSLNGRDPVEIAAERYKLPALPPITAEGRARIAQFVNPPTEARDVSFAVTVRDGRIDVSDLQGQAYGGAFNGGVALDLSRGQPPFPLTYDLNLQNGEATAFLTRWTRLGQALSGKVNFRISGTANLDESLLPAPDAVDASGRAAFRQGRFLDFSLTRALADQFQLDADRFTSFRRLGGSFTIENGAVLVDGWQLASQDLEMGISGAAGLGGSLDLQLSLELPISTLQKAGLVQGAGGALGDIVGQLAGDDQAIEMSVGVGGTMSSPRMQIDREALRTALEKRLQGRGRDLLERLFKPPN